MPAGASEGFDMLKKSKDRTVSTLEAIWKLDANDIAYEDTRSIF